MPHERSNSMLDSGRGGIDPSGMTVLRPTVSGPPGSRAEGAGDSRRAHSRRERRRASSRRYAIRWSCQSRRKGCASSSSNATDRASSTAGARSSRREREDPVRHRPRDRHASERRGDRRAHRQPAVSNGERYGNWELSSDRANAARRVMLVEGLRGGQLRAVRGFADNDLRVPDQPLDPRNRRVSIVVRSQSAAQLESAIRQGLVGTLAPNVAP